MSKCIQIIANCISCDAMTENPETKSILGRPTCPWSPEPKSTHWSPRRIFSETCESPQYTHCRGVCINGLVKYDFFRVFRSPDSGVQSPRDTPPLYTNGGRSCINGLVKCDLFHVFRSPVLTRHPLPSTRMVGAPALMDS